MLQYSSSIHGQSAIRTSIPLSSNAALDNTDANAANTPEQAAIENPTIIMATLSRDREHSEKVRSTLLSRSYSGLTVPWRIRIYSSILLLEIQVR